MPRSTTMFATLALVFTLVLTAIVQSPVIAAPVGPNSDAVNGGGRTITDILSINAHVNPNGKVMGHIDAKNTPDYASPFLVVGTVNCLKIIGNRAAIGGELTKFEAEGWDTSLYHGWYFYVEDNSANGTPDKISYQYPVANPVTTCPNPNPGTAFFPMLEGNVNVRKGTP